MKKYITIILLMFVLSAKAQTYWLVDISYQLTDGSDQGTSIKQMIEPKYNSVLADLKAYVAPYKIKPYSLTMSITKVPGVIKLGNGDKFKPNKKMPTWNMDSVPTMLFNVVEMKHDSVIKIPNYKGRIQDFLTIDYPKNGYPYYVVKFKRSSVTFMTDSSFTYVDKFN